MAANEQIGKARQTVGQKPPGHWKWIKRRTNKWRRRQERADVENAPIKTAYTGWYD